MFGSFLNKIGISIAGKIVLILMLAVFWGGSNTGVFAQMEDFPEKIAPVDAPFEMPEMKRPEFPDTTFNIEDFKNIALTGKGTLNGHGQHWWKWAKNNSYTDREEATKVPLSRRNYGKGAGEEGMRPNFVVFWKSRNILVEDITLKDSPMWNINPVYCENIIVRGITFNTYYSGPGITGPSPLIRKINIRNISIDRVPRVINMYGLPDKWLEDFTLENISVKNAIEGVRLARIKNLTMKNVNIHSEKRAMVADDVFELNL
jgi:polygalacturonase